VESLTKNRQPVATLRAMVKRAYGAQQLPEDDTGFTELGDGWFNVVYRIRLRDGQAVVLKIAPPAGVEVMTYERGVMAAELEALRLIREHTTVPVPDVHFVDRSRELCDADYFFMSHIDADNAAVLQQDGRLDPAGCVGYDRARGMVNRQLNQIRGNWFGALTGPGRPDWRSCFLGLLEDVLDDGERRAVDLGIGYDAVRAVIGALAADLDPVTEPQLVEWDLWAGNTLVRDGRIIAVIDHERAFFGDPLVEYGFAGLDLPEAFGDASAFVAGYGLGDLDTAARRRRWLYTLYLVLVMVVETEYRALPDERYRWAREQLGLLWGRRPVMVATDDPTAAGHQD